MCIFSRFWGFALLSFVLMGLVACHAGGNDSTESVDSMARSTAEASMVTDVHVRNAFVGVFDRERLSNGLLEAQSRATVLFGAEAMVREVCVREGLRVKKDEVLGRLDDRKLKLELENARITMEKTHVALEDLLLSQGFELKDSASIPKGRFRTACIQSGYADAKLALISAQRACDETVVRAPIAGEICNLEAVAYNPSSAFKKFCEITDRSVLRVSFGLLESELGDLRVGQSVRIEAFSIPNRSFSGKVVSVNPLVDEKGMIRVRAEVSDLSGELLVGMNVKVVLKQSVSDCLMVPKTAVVLRQNRKVVFVHEKGLAIWKYVTTGLENSEFVQITEGIQAGESVIVDQNFNLAHEGKVKVLVDAMAK